MRLATNEFEVKSIRRRGVCRLAMKNENQSAGIWRVREAGAYAWLIVGSVEQLIRFLLFMVTVVGLLSVGGLSKLISSPWRTVINKEM